MLEVLARLSLALNPRHNDSRRDDCPEEEGETREVLEPDHAGDGACEA